MSLGRSIRDYSQMSGHASFRSLKKDQDHPFWLDRGPGSEYPVKGTVTEIEVPGTGIFPLYAICLSYVCPVC
jgi:hypothetical protein